LLTFSLKEESFENNPWIWEEDFIADEIIHLASFIFPEMYKAFLDDVELGTFYNTYDTNQQAHVISVPASDSLLLIHKVIKDHLLLFFDADFQKLAEIGLNAQLISPTPFFTPDRVYLKLLNNESDDYEGYVRLKTNL